MRRTWMTVALAVVALAASAPARADVTMKSTTTVSGGPMAMETTSVFAVKGNRARVDMTIMGQDRSVIIDLGAKKVTMLDHAAKTAQVMDVAAFQGMTDQMTGGFTVDKAEVTPTGQKKEIGGIPCEEHRFVLSGRMSPMGQVVSMSVNGTQWLAKDAKGLADLVVFSAAARDAGIQSIMGVGGAGVPIPQKDLAKLIEAKGVALQADMDLSMSGEGDAAAMLSQMGPMKMHMSVVSISSDPVAEERFAVPAGYASK